MTLETWWSAVRPETRAWLVAHNGEPLAPDVLEEITRVSGPIGPDALWAEVDESGAVRLSDAAVDWVEAVANDETPPSP